MTSMLRYEVVDVFADAPFSGNPLAVVLGTVGLGTGQLQALAREFNLSETAFPLPPTQEGADYRVRIFTPAAELPFAGHPSVGTAWLLAARGELGERVPGTVVQECGAGLVTLEVAPGGGPVELTGAAPHAGPALDAADAGRLAAAVGLASTDLAAVPARQAGAGLVWTYLAVRAEALPRASASAASLRQVADLAPMGVYVHTLPDGDGDGACRARGFTADVSGVEDPATGSAALGLGAHLVASGVLPGDGAARYSVAQGAEMGRPSRLLATVEAQAGTAVRCRVAGQVHRVAHGEVAVPPEPPR